MTGSRRPLLKVKAGASSPLPPGATAPANPVRPSGAPGRPVSNIGKYLIKPTAEMDTGFELINSDPNILNQVHQKYLKAGELPPALQPKFLRKPEVMEAGRSKAISRGWRKPRSRQG